MEEIWKDLIGNEEFYQISNFGRLKIKKKYKVAEQIRMAEVYPSNGYLIYSIQPNGVRQTVYAHLEVAKHFVEKKESDFYVHHIDGNKQNNKHTNLKWCSHIQGKLLKQVPTHKGYYVSEDGKIVCAHNRIIPVILNHITNAQGYQGVAMVTDNHKKTQIGIHRFVMLAWNGLPPNDKQICVHHLDHDKKNNHASNLKWVSYSENIKYNYDTGGQIGKAGLEGKFGRDNPGSKLIRQYHPEEGLINVFWGASEAARLTNSNAGHISGVCLGKKKKHNGFIWRYVF